jgi:hypothetical protein
VPKGLIMSIWPNCLNTFRAVAAGAALVMLWSTASPVSALDQQQQAQEQPQQQPEQHQRQQQQRLSDEQLQQLVAPIALYPDPLLAQILTASTYPLEVVMAARWSRDNPNLKGKEIENAMQQQSWDPSIKGLTAVPQALAMMNDKLDWTQQLGEAFLAQPKDVTKAVQALRAKAEATGNLKTTNEQKVTRVAAPAPPRGEAVVVPEYIAIEPVEPEVIYVPVYDPVVIFGVGYWSPAFVPFFWYPPWWTVGPVWGFWPALWVGPALWCNYNWGYGHVQINVVQFNTFNHTTIVSSGGPMKWSHDPIHHTGVPYKNVSLQQKFGSVTAGRNLKQNTYFNLKQNTDLNPKQSTNLNTANKNLNTGNKNLNSNLNGNTRNLHTNQINGNKNFGGGNQNGINRPQFTQQKFSNPRTSNSNVQTLNRRPVETHGWRQ